VSQTGGFSRFLSSYWKGRVLFSPARGKYGTDKSAQLEPGSRLIREWNGVSHVVDVTEAGGVLWRGTSYRSLSAVAREITGAHWSGSRFFGLKQRSNR